MDRNSLSAIPSISEYFYEHPLSEGEVARGKALRVVGCLRSAEGVFGDGFSSFLWIVLSCSCKGVSARPSMLGFSGGGRIPRKLKGCAGEPLALHSYELGGRSWTVSEFEFVIPAFVDRFVVHAGMLVRIVDRAGMSGYLSAYGARIANASVDRRYAEWLDARARSRRALHEVPVSGPLMSIVTPAYKTPAVLLQKMLESVLAQTYTNWELIVVNASPEDTEMRSVFASFDDARIRIIDQEKNLGISGNTNIGIAACTGEFVSFFDHDDTVEPDALAELVRAINGCEVAPDLLYCDEDNIDEDDNPFLPLFKPAFNIDLLLSNNYVIHWLTVRHALLRRVELSDNAVNGAQDYDLTFKIAELGGAVVRVPEVLYHWRIHSGSTAGDPGSKSYAQDAGARAIEGHLRRVGSEATVERGAAYFTYKAEFSTPVPAPSILVACAGGCSPKTRDAVRAYGVRHSVEAGFTAEPSFAEGCQSGASLLLVTTAEHDLDLANLEVLVANACRQEVFAVSPRVVREDGLLDYAGMIVLPNGALGRLLHLLPEQDGGYVGRAQRPYDSSVLNVGCCLVDLAKLRELGAGSEFETLEYQLADFCVMARERGWSNVFMPYATARYNVPVSAIGDEVGEGVARDVGRFLSMHPEFVYGDPSHNPNFDPWSLYYGLAWGEKSA